MRQFKAFLALAVGAGLLFAACSASPASQAPAEMTDVRLQLQWVPQAQFAGYFAAAAEGYYEDAGLNVTFVPASPDIAPQVAGSAADGPEFTISWVPKVLEARVGTPPSDLVNIAQMFQRSGTLSVSWKDSNITGPADFAGKKVGVWGFGNEFEVGRGPQGGPGGRNRLREGQPAVRHGVAAAAPDQVAEAMIYNEYAQVLEAVNPETGELYQPEDLNVINYNDEGTAMLQDALFARKAWLDQEGNEDVATRFLEASFRGWIFCRDNPDKCIQYTVDQGSTLGAGHQAWMMNEVNPLVWPSPNGIGMMDKALWDQTVAVTTEAGIISEIPPADAYRIDLAEAALANITDVDTKGADFTKGSVEVTEGGN